MHTELSNKFQSFTPAIEKAQELRHQPLRPNQVYVNQWSIFGPLFRPDRETERQTKRQTLNENRDTKCDRQRIPKFGGKGSVHIENVLPFRRLHAHHCTSGKDWSTLDAGSEISSTRWSSGSASSVYSDLQSKQSKYNVNTSKYNVKTSNFPTRHILDVLIVTYVN